MCVAPILEGGSNIKGESLSCQLHFQSTHKAKKNSSSQGSLKFREVSNTQLLGRYRERENLSEESYSYLPTYLLSQLVSQNKHVLLHVVVLCFLQVFRSPKLNHAYKGKKGCGFQLCQQFCCDPTGSRYGNAQMSLYIELDRHS